MPAELCLKTVPLILSGKRPRQSDLSKTTLTQRALPAGAAEFLQFFNISHCAIELLTIDTVTALLALP